MSGASVDNGSDLGRFFSAREAAPQQPWPRYRLGEPDWLDLATHLTIVDWALLGLWGDLEEVPTTCLAVDFRRKIIEDYGGDHPGHLQCVIARTASESAWGEAIPVTTLRAQS